MLGLRRLRRRCLFRDDCCFVTAASPFPTLGQEHGTQAVIAQRPRVATIIKYDATMQPVVVLGGDF